MVYYMYYINKSIFLRNYRYYIYELFMQYPHNKII